MRKVIVAAPVKEQALNVVMGCNDRLYDPADPPYPDRRFLHHELFSARCEGHSRGLGIRHGVITTTHDVTNTQVLVDAPHKDLRRARSALNSLIPTSTGSATAISLIYPELKGKLNGVAIRVPLLNASLTDCVFEVERETTIEEVNDLLRQAADGPLAGILGFETKPLVSVDYLNDPRSSIVDALSTMVIDGTLVKILAWYDNEWGYANRLMELTRMVAQSLPAGVAAVRGENGHS